MWRMNQILVFVCAAAYLEAGENRIFTQTMLMSHGHLLLSGV